jgi:hypothetical protein
VTHGVQNALAAIWILAAEETSEYRPRSFRTPIAGINSAEGLFTVQELRVHIETYYPTGLEEPVQVVWMEPILVGDTIDLDHMARYPPRL